MRTARALFACVMVLVGCHRSPAPDLATAESFKASARLLDQLTNAPTNSIPDAVLNRTRCVIVVPASTMEGRTIPAAASCRDKVGRWQTAESVEFTAAKSRSDDVLIFVLNERAASRFKAGGLRLGVNASDRAGPIVQQVATITDAELAADALSYRRSRGALTGTAVPGTFIINPYAKAAPTEPASKFVRAVTSFFNTITPIGIIIHHSGVIPGDSKVPENTAEVDSFHRERGFDIVCAGHEYHVAYHYLIAPDGSVKPGRPERCEGAHARGYNSYLGIAVFGDFSSIDNPHGEKGQMKVTGRQMQALAQLSRRLMARYRIPLQRVLRHSDVASTRCPGDRFPFQTLQRMLQLRP